MQFSRAFTKSKIRLYNNYFSFFSKHNFWVLGPTKILEAKKILENEKLFSIFSQNFSYFLHYIFSNLQFKPNID